MKRMKNLLALTLAAALCLTLFGGCGDKAQETQTKTLAQELGYGYLSDYKDLDLDIDYTRSVSVVGGSLYVCADSYDEETWTSSTLLYAIDPATQAVTEIPVPEMVHDEEAGVNEYLQALSICPDGSGYWMITETYTYQAFDEDFQFEDEIFDDGEPIDLPKADPNEVPDDPEGDAEAEDDAGLADGYDVNLLSAVAVSEAVPAVEAEEWVGGSEAPQDVYTAKKCDMQGNVLLEMDLSDAAAEQEWFYPQYMEQGGDGTLYIATEGLILRYSAEGQRLEDVTLNPDTWIQNMAVTGSGTLLINYYDSESGSIALGTLEGDQLSGPLDIQGLNVEYFRAMTPGEGNTVLVSDGTYLYSVDITTKTASKLLSWLDSDINGNNITAFASGGEDTVLVMLEDMRRLGASGGGYEVEWVYELGTLTKTPADQLPERTILTLGAVYLDNDVYDAVVDFNRKSDTYRITLVDYSQYNTDDDYSLGAQQLNLDVVSGNCPDLICMNDSSNFGNYVAKGVLANLTELIEKDDSISMDDLMAGPINAYTRDGKLYGMPFSFGMQTLYGSSKLLGDRDSWTLSEMAQVISALDDDTMVMYYYSRDEFLTNMIRLNMDLYVDYGKGTCDFENDAFKALLQAASKLPEDYTVYEQMNEEANAAGTWIDQDQIVQSGECLLTVGYISGSSELKSFYSLYTAENGFVNIGFPTENGSGGMLRVYNALAISDKCKHKDGAWEFMKTTLSDDFQSQQWNLPVTVSAFDDVAAQAMERSYWTNPDGEKEYYDDTRWLGETEYTVDELTQEQVDDFKNYVNNAAAAGTYDEELNNIITEEAAAYFAGDKTADEVASLIQNRAKIYLGEIS